MPTCVLATWYSNLAGVCIYWVIPHLHWFNVAKWKGQHWLRDTGSICGSLFTPPQAVIICYNPGTPAWPVIWHVIHSAYTSFIVISMNKWRIIFYILWILSCNCTAPSSDIWATSRWTPHRNDNKKWLKGGFAALKQQRNWCTGGSCNKKKLIYLLDSVYSVMIVTAPKKWRLKVLFLYIYDVLYSHQTSVRSYCSWEVRIQGHLTSLKQFYNHKLKLLTERGMRG